MGHLFCSVVMQLFSSSFLTLNTRAVEITLKCPENEGSVAQSLHLWMQVRVWTLVVNGFYH